MTTNYGQSRRRGRSIAFLQETHFPKICEIRVIRGFNPDGFTLLEVLIAMAIIGVGLIALLTLFPIGLRSSRLAGDFTTAAFIGQQALDNMRASAQVYDPGDYYFDNTYNPLGQGPPFPDPLPWGAVTDANSTNHNGLGYYELPISAVKGYFSAIRFPTEPAFSQWYDVVFTSATDYNVKRRDGSILDSGTVGVLFSSSEISFILYDNPTGSELGAVYNSTYDVNLQKSDGTYQTEYDDFRTGDTIRINIEMRAGVPYYWYAMRSPVTEDQDLDGILDGRLPNGSVRSGEHNQRQEDTGIDLISDFWDSDMRAVGTGTAGFQTGLDRVGETGFTGLNDPHGDNRYAYYSAIGWFSHPTNPGTYPLVEINPNGTEGNGRIDAYPDDYIQKVTVTVGWREGGQDRSAAFSASIANQFR
ncbi:MAG: hypothetical protein Kow0099_22290 [Candidatus Abyssubacteria bacterium]